LTNEYQLSTIDAPVIQENQGESNDRIILLPSKPEHNNNNNNGIPFIPDENKSINLCELFIIKQNILKQFFL
jgi:hypothetical protein